MKLILENWKNFITESDDIPQDVITTRAGDTETEKGINKTFDDMLRGKYFDAYQILHNDGIDPTDQQHLQHLALDNSIPNLLRKYFKFSMKFQKIDGRFVPPDAWLKDIAKGDKSFFRKWNNEN